jgi:peptidoglycan/LPS O-acetylase OafA/YrhL
MTGGYPALPDRNTVSAMTDADRSIARKRVKARRDFAGTAVSLTVVAVLLIVVWFVTTGGSGYFWPMWPLIGFAIAIIFSGLNAFGLLNRDVTDGDIEAELERMKRKG